MKIVTTPQLKTDENKSKIYLKYEKLLLEIENKQKFRSNLHDGLQKASAKINTELAPLINESHLLSKEYVIRLDKLAIEIGVGKFNREWFESYISDELDALLEFFGHQDKELSALYKKYTGLSPKDLANDEDAREIVSSMSEMFGFEVDIEELIQKGEKVYFEEHKEQILEHLDNEHSRFSETETEGKEPVKNKNKKQAQEPGQLAKDARSIYMRLVKKFHPDLEKDPEIIKQKNEIIKQVTKAYQENDFYKLLKLQITYLDDNEPDANKIADDLLKRYNKILQKQLDELEAWVHDARFTSGALMADFIDKNGKFSPQKFTARRRDLEKENASLKFTIADSQKRPKSWFKEQMSMIKQVVQQDKMREMFSEMFNNTRF